MENTTDNVRQINPNTTNNTQGNTFRLPNMGMSVQEVTNPYKFQFYLDWGQTSEGPWTRVGINNLEYQIGYLPEVKNG